MAATRVLWLTLLLGAGSAVAQPATPPQTCRVIGRVFRIGAARDTLPVQLAQVLVLELGRGCWSDVEGRFEIPDLPPGTSLLEIRGSHPTVAVRLSLMAGETIYRDIRVGTEYDLARDSLTALGKWPPSLDPELLEHMRRAHDVRLFRLDGSRPGNVASNDPEHAIGFWPIVYEAHRPSRPIVTQLIEGLRASPYEIPGLEGGPKKMCGGFSPGVDVRFIREGVSVDVLLCYSCAEIAILRSGRWAQTGDFEDRRFNAFARQAFPQDPVLSKLPDPSHGHSR